MKNNRNTLSATNFFGSKLFESFAVVRFSVLALLIVACVGGASASGSNSEYLLETDSSSSDVIGGGYINSNGDEATVYIEGNGANNDDLYVYYKKSGDSSYQKQKIKDLPFDVSEDDRVGDIIYANGEWHMVALSHSQGYSYFSGSLGGSWTEHTEIGSGLGNAEYFYVTVQENGLQKKTGTDKIYSRMGSNGNQLSFEIDTSTNSVTENIDSNIDYWRGDIVYVPSEDRYYTSRANTGILATTSDISTDSTTQFTFDSEDQSGDELEVWESEKKIFRTYQEHNTGNFVVQGCDYGANDCTLKSNWDTMLNKSGYGFGSSNRFGGLVLVDDTAKVFAHTSSGIYRFSYDSGSNSFNSETDVSSWFSLPLSDWEPTADLFEYANQKLYVGYWTSDSDSSKDMYRLVRSFNAQPQFNSSQVTPDPPLIGENVSYGAEVYDSDGSVDYTNLTLEYGGSTVLSDEQRTGTTSPVWNDVFTPQTGNKWLNATFETLDDKGAVTTTEINRYLSDEAPAVDLQDPGINWKYEVPISFTIPETDSQPDESHTCDIRKNSSTVRTVTVDDGETYTDTVRTDLGNWELQVECTDPAGNTNTSSESYSVKAYNITDLDSVDVTSETKVPGYTINIKTGEMVNSVETELVWNGTVYDSENLSSSGIEVKNSILEKTIPLVSQNRTNVTWNINFTGERDAYSGSGTVMDQKSSENRSQEVRWSYWLNNSFLDDRNGKYIEREDVDHRAVIRKKTGKASLTGSTTYWRNGDTAEMFSVENSSDSVEFKAEIDSGTVSSNMEEYNVSSTITASFNGGSRLITTPNSTAEVYRINLTKCNAGLNSAEALKFNTVYEGTQDPVETDIMMDADVWKTGEVVREFAFNSEAKTTHDFCVYPSWAEYTIDTEEKLLQYEQTHDNSILRSYFLLEEKISNSTTEIPLYTINRTETDRISYQITDDTGSAYADVVCRIDRYFPGEGKHQTVAQIKSGSDGRSETFLEVNEIYYQHICFQDGQELDFFDNQIIINPMRLQIGSDTDRTDYFDYYNAFDGGLTFKANQTHLTVDYYTDENVQEVTLDVDNQTSLGYQDFEEKSSSSASGSLTISGLNTTENRYRYQFRASYPDGNNQVHETGHLGENESFFPDGLGIMITMALVVSGFGLGRFHPVASIMLGVTGAVVAWLFGAFPIGSGAIMILVSIAGVVSWILSL